jgi:RNA polymerase sigma-70 factor (ECF subfamily)
LTPKSIRWKNGTATAARAFDKAASAPLQSRQVEQGSMQSLNVPVKDRSPVSNETSDERLATRIATQDVSAFGIVYDRYSQPVFAMAGHMLGVHEAEEAAQEIFMRLWHKASQYDPARGPFSHWFMSIARNHILDKLRARSERLRIVVAEEIDMLLAEAADPRVDVLEQVWRNQRGDALLGALQRIPAEQRRVIVLAYFGGMSQSEIAIHLGIPLGTVKKRIRLGLQKLRAGLSPHALLDLDWGEDDTLQDTEPRVNMNLSNE